MVVLVDDDPLVTTMYRIGLERAGYEVATCFDGDELYRLLDRLSPDIVVLDWTLPGLSGGDILESLRQDPRTHDLMVVMLSALSDAVSEAGRAMNMGALAWLDKLHTEPAKLAAIIGSLFEARKAS